MAQITIKKSSVANKVPLSTDLAYGELALNYQDGKLYYKKADNSIDSFLSATTGVSSFNTRIGAITLNSSDVTTALGFTPFSKAGGTLTGNLIVGSVASGNNISTIATLGNELVPALEAENWTGTNWSAGSGALTHITGSIGSISPTIAITPVVGITYKVTFTTTAGGVYLGWSFGGNTYNITGAGTYTIYTIAKTTGSLSFINNTVGDPTIVISALSIKALTAATGTLTVDGLVTMNSSLAINSIGIGMGTTVPTAPLQIVDIGSGLKVSRSTNYNQFSFVDAGQGAAFRFGGQGGDKPVQFINLDASNYGFEFIIAGSTKVSIANSGNFSTIGTISHTGLVATDGTNVDQIKTLTKSLTMTTDWQDTGIKSTDLATGTYMVQLVANDTGSGGTNNNEYYSGTMSWYSGDTNSAMELPTDEITLHRAGGSGDGALYLRTYRTPTADVNNLKLQIYSNTANASAANYVFKFRRII